MIDISIYEERLAYHNAQLAKFKEQDEKNNDLVIINTMEFKWPKEEKALQYAKKSWGVYFDDVHPDCAIISTMGEISQEDFLAGYNQALEDSKASEMLEMLEKLREAILSGDETRMLACSQEAKQLIKEATYL